MGPAAERGDTAALAVALREASRFAPDPSWNQGENSWQAMSEAAAAKAEAGDLAGARASCKGCHRAWRSQYKAQFRARPLPPAGS